jgi:hypothetical protein
MLFQLVSTISDGERRFSQRETVSIRMTSFVCPCVFLLTFSDAEDGGDDDDDDERETMRLIPSSKRRRGTSRQTDRERERGRERTKE